MKPLNANKIRRKLNELDPIINENLESRCVNRLAFEQEESAQLSVIQLDWNTLASYRGKIRFSDGMRKIIFYGTPLKKSKNDQSMNCFSKFKKSITESIK